MKHDKRPGNIEIRHAVFSKRPQANNISDNLSAPTQNSEQTEPEKSG